MNSRYDLLLRTTSDLPSFAFEAKGSVPIWVTQHHVDFSLGTPEPSTNLWGPTARNA